MSRPEPTRQPDAADSALDAWLPRFDVGDSLQCPVPHSAAAAAWALRTYNLRAHAGALSPLLRAAHRVLPAPPPKTSRLAQLGCLGDVALRVEEGRAGGLRMVLGFIGEIWRPGSLLRLPGALEFVADASRAPGAACVVWLLEVVPVEPDAALLRLSMRLRYPRQPPARWICAAYWRGVRRASAWMRLQLLRSIARHAAQAPRAAA